MLIASLLGDWNDHMGGGNGWWAWGALMMIVSIGVVALVVWLIVRGNHYGGPSSSQSAADILKERYARGEIDSKDYDERLAKLR
jgi:putative membrane protein